MKKSLIFIILIIMAVLIIIVLFTQKFIYTIYFENKFSKADEFYYEYRKSIDDTKVMDQDKVISKYYYHPNGDDYYGFIYQPDVIGNYNDIVITHKNIDPPLYMIILNLTNKQGFNGSVKIISNNPVQFNSDENLDYLIYEERWKIPENSNNRNKYYGENIYPPVINP